MLSPAGGAGAEGLSRDAEGQRGTEQLPVVEKFTSVGRNSLDIFSPAREGQYSHKLLKGKSYRLFSYFPTLENVSTEAQNGQTMSLQGEVQVFPKN